MIRSLPSEMCLIVKRGRGKMIASHQVSADNQWCFPFAERERRSGEEAEALRRDAREEGLRCAGTSRFLELNVT